ncbi:MAG TPA: metallophosphoesterase family protein [Burkholderiales bacterium]|nr:metallophosphoesterase family protein [Burkholderiales bacterium]
MALYGVLGDIHGNLEALRAVLGALDERGARELLCVGDIIGYNADPDECVALLGSRSVKVIAGNHDLIATRRLGFERCSNKARYALERTRRRIGAPAAAWLGSLPSSLLVEGRIALVHGGVRDVQLYMKTPQLVARNAELLRLDFPSARICFFGHSHAQKVYEVDAGVSEREPAGGALDRGKLYFVNAGSVDAQRKAGQKLAECAVLDTDAWAIDFLRVPYDAAATEAKAVVGGYRILPIVDRVYTWRRRLVEAQKRYARPSVP